MAIVSLEVDSQRSFSPLCPEELPVEDALSIVPELNYQATLADFRVFSREMHSPKAPWIARGQLKAGVKMDLPNIDSAWPAHAIAGTEGAERLPGLPGPEHYDFLIYKGVEPSFHPYGVCFHDLEEKISTGFLEWLHHQKIGLLIVGGLDIDHCVKGSVLQLLRYTKGAEVILNLAASRGMASDTVVSALDEMQKAGAVIIKNRAELEAEIRAFKMKQRDNKAQ